MTEETNPNEESGATRRILAGHYSVERELGRGGMATVYLSTDLRDGRKVAVKLLRKEYANAVAAERFFREVDFISRLDHPFIPKLIETGVSEGIPFYVMTYVEGEPLRKRLDREKQLPIGEAVCIALDTMKPMRYAHDNSIVHRDIKPDNIVLSPTGVYVLDFGIARAIADAGGERLTRTGLTVGTPAYISPEQALGDRDLDQRSDIFSLGCVVYEMLAGVAPFAGPTPQVLIARRFASVPRSLREIRGDVPEALDRAVLKAMERSPRDRWSSTLEFEEALLAAIAAEPRSDAPVPLPRADASPPNELLEKLRRTFAENYRVDEEMKGGGMSRLFRATDLELNRRVVIKILPPDLTSPMMLARFRRECEVTARLQHPHILPIISAGVRDGLAYYIMPFFEGESLRARLNREGRLPVADGVRILREMTDALSCAHDQGVIHRDIKPENILILGGHAVLADFGIASALSGSGSEPGERITGTGISLGTVGYMAPEQALGEKNVDGRADIYSIGVVGYEIFAGTPPFTGATDQAILVGHLTREPEALEKLREDTPVRVSAAIRKALQKDPASRFRKASAFHDALDAAGVMPDSPVSAAVELASAPASFATATTDASFTAPKERAGSKRWKIGVPASAIALVALAAFGAAYGRFRDGPPAGPSFDQRNIAVLYFRDLSPRRDLGHLADAFTEELIAKLEEVNALDVVSKNGAQQIRLAGIEPDSAARVLKVGTLVEGSVEPVGDRLRIVVALTDGSNGDVLERASFEYPAADPLGLRERLVQDVSEFLRQQLGKEVRLTEWKSGTSDPHAWLLAQRGEKLAKEADNLATAGDTAAAARRLLLADSILALSAARDGKWVEPVIMRGTVAYRMARIASLAPDMRRWADVGLTFAGQALGLDARNAAARELRGTLRYWKWRRNLTNGPGDAAEVLRLAEEDLRAAVRAAPHRASAWSLLSSLFANKGDPMEAAMAARRAYEEDAYLSSAPEIVWRLYSSAYDNQQAGPAKQWCAEGERRFPLDPRFVKCRLWLLTMPGTRANVDSAWQLVADLRKLTPIGEWAFNGREAQMLVAAGLARAGLRDSSRHVLERSRGDATVDPERELQVREAIVRVILGDGDEAFRLINMYLVANPNHRTGMAQTQSWWWRDLKNNPRYKEMFGGGG